MSSGTPVLVTKEAALCARLPNEPLLCGKPTISLVKTDPEYYGEGVSVYTRTPCVRLLLLLT